MHLNQSRLPPVDCPLIVELPTGELVEATRKAFTTDKNGDLEYHLTDGQVVVGRLRWTYP